MSDISLAQFMSGTPHEEDSPTVDVHTFMGAPVSATGIPFAGQGGAAPAPAEAPGLVSDFVSKYKENAGLSPENTALLGGQNSPLTAVGNLVSDANAAVGAGVDAAVTGLDKLSDKIGLTNLPHTLGLDKLGLPDQFQPGTALGAGMEAFPLAGAEFGGFKPVTPNFQAALRGGDIAAAEAELKTAGYGVNDATRAELKNAADYYKQGGDQDVVIAKPSETAPGSLTTQDHAIAQANDVYEAAKQQGDPTAIAKAYDDLLVAHGQPPLPKDLPQAEAIVPNPNALVRQAPVDTPVPANPLAADLGVPSEIPPPGTGGVSPTSGESAVAPTGTQAAPLIPTALERKMGRFMRGPDHDPEAIAAANKAVEDGLPVERETTPAEPATPPTESDVVSKMTEALKNAGKVRADQESLYTEARKARIQAAREAGKGLTGEEKLNAELSAHKGEMPKSDFEGVRHLFTQDEITDLMGQVEKAGLSHYDALNGRVAIRKLMEGTVPQTRELKILSKVFPVDFIKAALKHREILAKDFGDSEQAEMFSQGETLATGEPKSLLPETTPPDPDKFYRAKGQGDLFEERKPDVGKPGEQLEMFPGEQALSTGPIRELLPETKPVDPSVFRRIKGQGDFFRDEPSFVREPSDRSPQLELFPNSEVTSTGDSKPLKPEPKPVDPDKFVYHKGQGDFFRDEPSFVREHPDKGKQLEMFPNSEVTATGEPRSLLPETKPVDPDKFVDDKNQGDLFRSKPAFEKKAPPKGTQKPQDTSIISGAASLSRGVMSSTDLSAPQRQGIVLIGTKAYWRSILPMFKYAVSKQGFEGLQQSIRDSKYYDLMQDHGLAITDADGGLTHGEEQFQSKLLGKIPVLGRVYEGSERAYIGFLNKLRSDYFSNFVQKFEDAGINPRSPEMQDTMNAWAKYVNNATGRGDLGRFSSAGSALGTALFSPRLMASRVNLLNPKYYMSLPPVVRREAIRNMLSFGAAAGAALALAKMAGLDVTLDPRSSDFAKIKVGNTRYDILGGFGQYLVLGARLGTGEYKGVDGSLSQYEGGWRQLARSARGEEHKAKFGAPTTFDVVSNFFTNKTAPFVSLGIDFLRGKDATGTPFDVQKELMSRYIPLIMQDAYDVTKDRGLLQGIPMAIPGVFGAGMQTYGPRPASSKRSFSQQGSAVTDMGNFDTPASSEGTGSAASSAPATIDAATFMKGASPDQASPETTTQSLEGNTIDMKTFMQGAPAQ